MTCWPWQKVEPTSFGEFVVVACRMPTLFHQFGYILPKFCNCVSSIKVEYYNGTFVHSTYMCEFCVP